MKIVLHICCGVCAAGAGERLILEGHKILGFFYNPNIYSKDEYQKRLEATYKVAKKLDFPLKVSNYEREKWLNKTHFLKNEPEGGKRCEICFSLRLEKTYLFMLNYGWDRFTTTLTESPHKSQEIINQLGFIIGGDKFLVRNFKKKDGFRRSIQLAKDWELYRQNYCGCIYSMR
jgi:predicted adenine nucleotide alpha hydrolase (AANH) superfamily ATPase